MENYDQFWLENNKPKRKVVVKIKRQKPKTVETTRKVIVVKKDLIARGPSASTPVVNDQNQQIQIDFDPEITTSYKWRSQFHYPEDSESSGYTVKEGEEL